MPSITHEERHERRVAIAEYCREGGTVAQACREFGVSATLVGTACQFAGITPRQPTREKHGRLRLIAALVNSARSYAVLARDFELSRQAVQQLAAKCTAAGLKVKARKTC